MNYIILLRPKDWAKNAFLFIPLFFAGEIFNLAKVTDVFYGFIAFCLISSSIYIFNDYRDIEADRKHPRKRFRPLVTGKVSKTGGLVLCGALFMAGFTLAYITDEKFLFVAGIYFVMNLAYSLGLKSIAILDIIILASGFVLRIKAGSVISDIPLSEWIIIMVFLLSLFMAIGKRRDDILIKQRVGQDMRKSLSGYNLDFLNVLLSLVSAVIIVAYFMYTMSTGTIQQWGTHRIYYTCIFVIMGLMRYLQIIFVLEDAGSPTKILYKDAFIIVILILWIASYFAIIYLKDITLFH